MSQPPLIDISNATFWRGRTRVFDQLSLSVEQGESLAILGPNGSGKTTLLKVLNREIYPVAAEHARVRILGRERWNVWELRRHIGLVSQDLQLAYEPTTSTLEVVISGFFSSVGVHGILADRVTDEQRSAAARALNMIGLGDAVDTPLERLSTGQQRRCLLARALVHEPRTLILDEPGAGLDFAAGFELMRHIGELAAAGRNIVLVTHHLSDIPPAIRRVVVLHDGRIVADGDKAEVLNDELLSRVYGTPIRIAEHDGYYLAWPGDESGTRTT